MKTKKVDLAEIIKEAGPVYKKQVNWARYEALAEIKGDLLNWLLFNEEEQKLAVEIIKKIEKYQKYLLKEKKDEKK